MTLAPGRRRQSRIVSGLLLAARCRGVTFRREPLLNRAFQRVNQELSGREREVVGRSVSQSRKNIGRSIARIEDGLLHGVLGE